MLPEHTLNISIYIKSNNTKTDNTMYEYDPFSLFLIIFSKQ